MFFLLLFLSLFSGVLIGAPPAKPDGTFRIAVLGCLRQDLPAPALQSYTRLNQDLNLWVGDNIYADTQNDPGVISRSYRDLAAIPGFRELAESAPRLVTWDDHDYGDNDEDRNYPLKEASRKIFLDFWDYRDRIPGERRGIWHSHFVDAGQLRVQFIMLDIRTQRDPPGPQADILGEEQWFWLQRQFEQPADLRILVSGTQILLPAESGSETWDEYPRSRNRLFRMIREAALENVVFVTGDQHYAEVARMPRALDFDAVELQFAGVNQGENPEFNSYRVATAATDTHSYAILDIVHSPPEWDPPHIRFHVYNAGNDAAKLIYRVNLSELTLPVRLLSEPVFSGRGTVLLDHDYPGLLLRYTKDGSDPDSNSPVYDGPMELEQTTTIKTALFSDLGYRRSPVHAFTLEKLEAVAGVKPGPLVPGLDYTYYEGKFQWLPDFSTLQPLASGSSRNLDPASLAAREDHFALRFKGYVQVPADATYRFTLRSDDGSRLFIHDRRVVDNDGSHSPRSRSGIVALKAGLHPVRIEYFEDYAGQLLEVRVERQRGDAFAPVHTLFLRRP